MILCNNLALQEKCRDIFITVIISFIKIWKYTDVFNSVFRQTGRTWLTLNTVFPVSKYPPIIKMLTQVWNWIHKLNIAVACLYDSPTIELRDMETIVGLSYPQLNSNS